MCVYIQWIIFCTPRSLITRTGQYGCRTLSKSTGSSNKKKIKLAFHSPLVSSSRIKLLSCIGHRKDNFLLDSPLSPTLWFYFERAGPGFGFQNFLNVYSFILIALQPLFPVPQYVSIKFTTCQSETCYALRQGTTVVSVFPTLVISPYTEIESKISAW